MTDFDKQFKMFEETVIPDLAPPAQRRDMKRAFYAGACGLLSVLADKVKDSNGKISSVNMLAEVAKLSDEMINYAQRVIDSEGNEDGSEDTGHKVDEPVRRHLFGGGTDGQRPRT